MKKFALTCLLLLNLVAFGQSNFDIGFKEGFKRGYCYSNNSSSYICTPPLPPLPPLPQINESRDNYYDGYYRGIKSGEARRNADDNSSTNTNAKLNNPPKFNPYVPQSPISSLTPAEREAYYDAKARQNQETAEAIGFLLQEIFTVDPQKKKNRQQARNIERLPQLDKKIDRELNKIKKEIRRREIRAEKGKKAKLP
jgi:hypothetical protein